MKDPRLLLGSLGFIAFVTVALAKEVSSNPHWLSHHEVDVIVAGEPAPPAPGSAADKADIQAELDAQNSRTPERIAEAKKDAGYSVALFTSIVGPNLTKANDPITFHFFDEVNSQIAQVVRESKTHWHRPRPYVAHPDIIHQLFDAGDYSYPSGHSTHSYAFAVVLGHVFLGHAQAFLDRAHQIAQSRVDAGVHYETDIKEGEIVGKEIARELLAKPAFQKELQAAQAEIAAQK